MAEKKKDAAKAANGGAETPRIDWALVERVLRCPAVTRIYLHGPPGVGKTYAAIQAAPPGTPVYVCTLTQEMPSSELRGSWIPRGGELAWLDGPVVRALREGALVVLNELLHASDDALSFLHPILESPETARLTLPTGETVSPAPGFRVIVTENRPPSELPDALRDRFDALLELREPHPDSLARLSPALREVARRSFAIGEDRSVSFRGWEALERIRHWLGLEAACLVVFGAERGAQLHDALVLAGAGAEA